MRRFALLLLLFGLAGCRTPAEPPPGSAVHVNVPGAFVNVREDGKVHVRGGPVHVHVPER